MATYYSIGHGTRSIDALIAELHAARIEVLVDVRRFPASRRNPQFGREELAGAMAGAEIAYVWRGEELGGRRSPNVDSRHPAWRVPAFRGYADHMDTNTFRNALDELVHLGRERPLAYMCAETLWWKCHRRLISDALAARNHDVVHLLSDGQREPHRPHPNMRIEDGAPVYDVGLHQELPLQP